MKYFSTIILVLKDLTLGMLGDFFNRSHTEIFFIFHPDNKALTFHLNCLFR